MFKKFKQTIKNTECYNMCLCMLCVFSMMKVYFRIVNDSESICLYMIILQRRIYPTLSHLHFERLTNKKGTKIKDTKSVPSFKSL